VFRQCGGGDAAGRGRWRMVAGASHRGLVTVARQRWQPQKTVRLAGRAGERRQRRVGRDNGGKRARQEC
jgi:hypothetical protein